MKVQDFKDIVCYEFNQKLVPLIFRAPRIISIDETIDAIVKRRASIARYGDGEFDIIFGRTEGYQKRDLELSKRLKRFLKRITITRISCGPARLL